MRSLRLAYLVSQYPAIHHTFIEREIRQLRAQDCDVAVASIRNPDRSGDGLTPDEQEEARTTYYIKAAGVTRAAAAHLRNLVNRPGRYFGGLALMLKLAGWDLRRLLFHFAYLSQALVFGEWMTHKRLTHVHSHFSSTVALLARRMFPLTLSITIHGPDEFNDVEGFAMARKVKDSLFLCAISHFARSQILRTCRTSEWRKIHVVPLGVDPEIYTPGNFREQPDPLELITVGRLAPVKGHAILLEALEGLAKQGRKPHLRIVGDGPERASLERAVISRGLSKQVIFEGWLTPAALLDLYRRADIFVLSSFAEGVPVVLMEAMALEIPCVAPCIHGIPELIENGVSGILIPPASPQALAGAVARLLDEPTLRRAVGRNGRQRVVANYSLVTNVTRLRDVFDHWL